MRVEDSMTGTVSSIFLLCESLPIQLGMGDGVESHSCGLTEANSLNLVLRMGSELIAELTG